MLTECVIRQIIVIHCLTRILSKNRAAGAVLTLFRMRLSAAYLRNHLT